MNMTGKQKQIIWKHNGTTDHLHKDKFLLRSSAVTIREDICIIFSEYADLKMYNRRKVEYQKEYYYFSRIHIDRGK